MLGTPANTTGQLLYTALYNSNSSQVGNTVAIPVPTGTSFYGWPLGGQSLVATGINAPVTAGNDYILLASFNNSTPKLLGYTTTNTDGAVQAYNVTPSGTTSLSGHSPSGVSSLLWAQLST